MNNTILDWNGTDYQSIYLRQLKENPVYYDDSLKLWVIYSYAYCKTILQHADALIPKLPVNDILNEKGKLLIEIPYAPAHADLPLHQIKELIQVVRYWVC